MADFGTTMSNYSPDNRLTFQQYVGMAARMKDRYGVSDLRAMKLVEETLQGRQSVLDERARLSGGQPWEAIRKAPGAEALWANPPAAPAQAGAGSGGSTDDALGLVR